MRRAWLVTAWTVMGAGLLAGCSAAERPLIAVHHGADGTPRLTMVPCGRDRVAAADLSVAPEPGSGTPDGPAAPATASAAEPEGWMAAGSSLTVGAVTFPLFSPPSSWAVRRWDGAGAVRPGFRYSVGFRAEGADDYAGVVRFTAQDLAGLKPGEVWAGGRAMPEKKFRALAEDSC
ncbi:hypothetical protein ACWGE1_28770 [Streptomyces sp. NPDC054932]